MKTKILFTAPSITIMRSIKRRFKKILTKNPCKSSYICFSEAIRGQKFSKQTIHRWFAKLVDKNDYCRSEKRAILSHLDNLSNTFEGDKIKDKLPC